MNGRKAKAQRRVGMPKLRVQPPAQIAGDKSRLKGAVTTSLAAAGLVTGVLAPVTGWALPQDGRVSAGSATITNPTATSLRVDQFTDRAVLDWRTFNIAGNESVRFQQPSAASIALNRVGGNEPSGIFGTLSANGQIFLINPSGILFSSSSRVDVGGLTASTLNITNQDFLSGNYRFAQDPTRANAAVVNQGLITAGHGGYVALLGAAVRNEGVIVANVGSISLAAGKAATLDMRGDGLIEFVVTDAVSGSVTGPSGESLASYVSNTGILQADGGMVTLHAKAATDVIKSVVNQEGVIRAQSMVERNGVVVLTGGDEGIVTVAGTIDVSGPQAGQTGGTVHVLGEKVGLVGATINASGAAGGGTILVGGDTHGRGTVQNAMFASVDSGSNLIADAVDHGNGGKVVVWSNDTTTFDGHISARGGANSGDGGFAEVSGKEHLVISGFADLRAPHGVTGMLLLDPGKVDVCHQNGTTCNGRVGDTFSDTFISTQLGTAGLTIDTSTDGTNAGTQDINFLTNTVAISWATANTLTFNAGRNITVLGSITGASGTLNLNFGRQNSGGTLDLSGATTVTAATVNAAGGTGTDTLIGPNTANTWNITANNTGTLNSINFSAVENLTGGTSTDAFVFSNGVVVSGTINGGAGTDTLDYTAYTTGITVNLQTSAATGTGGFSSIEAVTGGSGSDTLIGANAANTWNITANNAGNIGGTFAFTGIENLTGGTSTDAFVFSNGIVVSGTVTGGGGTDTLDLSAYTTANTWNITANNAGNVNGAIAFTGISNLTGGTSTDAFVFSNGVGVSGTINGGAGTDTLDYTAYTTGISVNRQTSAATGTGGFSSIEAVTGGSGSDTLVGANAANTWNITGNNAGNIGGTFAFTGIENLTGGTSTDSFVFSNGVGVSGNINGGTGTDTLNYTAYTTGISVNLQTSAATGIGGTFSNIEAVTGGSGSDTLVGANAANTWNITGNNAGNIGGTFAFTGIENLTGGTSTDAFVFSNGVVVSGTVTGGGGTDTLDLSAYTTANTWNITANNAGNVNGAIAFTGISNLTGGTSTDAFVFSNGKSVSGNVDGGGGSDTLNLSAYTTDVTVTLSSNSGGTATGIGGTFSNMEAVTGGSGTNTLTGPDQANTWNITGNNAGNVNSAFTFTAFQNLTGGTSTDAFVFSNGTVVDGTVTGGGGTDTLDLSAYTTANTWNITGNNAGNVNGAIAFTGISNLTGGASTDSFVFSDGKTISGTIDGQGGTDTLDFHLFSTGVTVNVANLVNIENLTGSAQTDTLIGANGANTWNITGNNAGNINSALSFTSFENLTGGTSTDAFVFSNGVGVSGTINGGTGTDTLNYTAYTTGVTVNLQTSAATGTGGFSSIEAVTGGSGTDTLVGANAANTWNITGNNAGNIGGTFAFTGIENLTGGTSTDAFVFSNGIVVSGTVTGGGGTDTLNLSAYTTANTWNITGNNAGNVNGAIAFTGISNLTGGTSTDAFVFSNGVGVSGTINGGAGTDTLDYTAYTTGITVNLQTSTATGTGGFSSIEAVTGGSGSDTLIGANAANTWNITANNAGNIGGTFAFTGIENLTGGTSTDAFVFSNGTVVDGTVTGGGGTDTLDLSAYTTANTWNITGNNAGNVNGAIAFTGISNLTGGSSTDNFVFSDGKTISGTIDGQGGTDTLDFHLFSTGVTVNAANLVNIENLTGSAQTDTLIGANGANTWNITGNNAGNINGALSFTSFENLTGGTSTDAFVFSNGAGVSGTINGGSGTDTLNYTAYTTGITVNLQTSAATGTGGFSSIEAVTGGSGSDTLVGTNAANTWNITANNAGNIGGTFAFTGIENLTGGTSTDAFVFSNGVVVGGTVTGGGGTDTLNLSAYTTANTWNITGNNAGNVNGAIAFTGISNLTGGTSTDAFVFSNGVGVSGNINGGAGADTLDYTAYTTGITINLQTSAATGIGGTFSNIEAVTGGSGSDTLIGANAANTWNITGNNAGNVNGAIAFTGIENLTGGASTDAFVFSNGTVVGGTVTGGGGTDTLDLSAYTTANTWNITGNNAGNVNGAIAFTGISNLTGGTSTDAFVFSNGVGVSGTINGGAGTDTLNYSAYTTGITVNLQTSAATGTGGFSNIEAVTGGSGSDTLIGANAANTWNITANNAGNVGGTFAFTGIENLTGGTSTDAFVFSNGVGVSGAINGGAGTDTLNYSAYTTGITVNLQTSAATGTGGFSNIEAVTGGSGSDTLIGANAANTWNITANNAGNIGGTFAFTGIENLTGGTSTDAFVFSNGVVVSGTVTGGGGTDTLNLSAYTTANTWNITGNNAGNVNGAIAFTGISNLTGGSSTDAFVFSDGKSVSGNVDGGGGSDTLNLSAYTTNVAVTLASNSGGTATGIGGTFSNVEAATGGSGTNTLTGPNQTNTWNITGNNAGNVNSAFTFTAFQNLTGGTGADTFNLNNNITGTVDGGAGDDIFNLAAGVTIGTLTGGTGTNTLVGPNVNTNWTITGADQGTAGSQAFTNMQNLTGGSADDTFTFTGTSSTLAGLIDGGAHTTGDSVSYAAAAPLTVTVGTSITNIENVTGGGAGFTLVGPNADSTWTITGLNSGTLATSGFSTMTFTAFENLTGGSGADTINVPVSFTGNINGGGGADLISIFNSAVLTGNVSGGTGSDIISISGTARVTGNVDGGTDVANNDTLDFSGFTPDTITNPTTATAGTIKNNPANPATDMIGGTYLSINNLVGNNGALQGADVPTVWTITGLNSGTFSQSGGAAQSFVNFSIAGGASTDDFIMGSTGRLTGSANGGGGVNTLTGANIANSWTITGARDGQLNPPPAGSVCPAIPTCPVPNGGLGGGFFNIDRITGGSAADTFTLRNAAAFGNPVVAGGPVITGGGGADTLIGRDVPNTWTITGANTGTVNGLNGSFSGIPNLTGGTGNDTFTFNAGSSLSGLIDGGTGTNNVSYAAIAGAKTVTFGTDITNISSVTGNDDGATKIFTLAGGAATDGAWTVTASNAGNVTGAVTGTLGVTTSFTHTRNLTGSTGNDSFTLAGGTLTGAIAGGGGIDTLTGDNVPNIWTITGANAGTVTGVAGGFSGIANLVGGSNTDQFTLVGGGNLAGSVNGGGGVNTLIGANITNSWTITGPNSGTVAAITGGFSNIQNLTGGSGADTFNLGAPITGILDGGGGADTLTVTTAVNYGGGTADIRAVESILNTSNATGIIANQILIDGATTQIGANGNVLQTASSGGVTLTHFGSAAIFLTEFFSGAINLNSPTVPTVNGAITGLGGGPINVGSAAQDISNLATFMAPFQARALNVKAANISVPAPALFTGALTLEATGNITGNGGVGGIGTGGALTLNAKEVGADGAPLRLFGQQNIGFGPSILSGKLNDTATGAEVFNVVLDPSTIGGIIIDNIEAITRGTVPGHIVTINAAPNPVAPLLGIGNTPKAAGTFHISATGDVNLISLSQVGVDGFNPLRVLTGGAINCVAPTCFINTTLFDAGLISNIQGGITSSLLTHQNGPSELLSSGILPENVFKSLGSQTVEVIGGGEEGSDNQFLGIKVIDPVTE